MRKCDHREVALLEEVDGRKVWICLCGRSPSTLPQLNRDEVIGWMQAVDAYTELLRAGESS